MTAALPQSRYAQTAAAVTAGMAEEKAEATPLTKTQKLAALLVMLGPESAATILKSFPPREIESISREMARSALITKEQQREILSDFSELALDASTAISAGPDVTRATLEAAFGTFKASDVLSRVAPPRPASGAMQDIADMEPRQLFNLIRGEQVQTIAFVISHLPTDKAAQVVGLLRTEEREMIIERLATLGPTPVEVAEKVLGLINAKLGIKQTRALTQMGGITTAADVLNAADKTLSRSLLGALEQRNPELGQAIRKKMFTFEDLLRLQPSAIQRLMREIDMRDLTLALKKASEPLRQLLLSSISKRAAEAVNEEMAFLGQVKLRDVEAAQFRIIDVVRKLEGEGEIELEASQSETNELVA